MCNCHKLEAVIALLFLGLLTAYNCRSGDTWTQMQVLCLPDIAALHRINAFSERHCAMQASDVLPSGILIAQFKPASLQCSLYRYQSVCRNLLSGLSTDCRVLIRFPIKYPAQLNTKLTNVWLGDDMTRFENAVCQPDEETNRIHPVEVQWMEEGAVFDGSSSHLAVNKSDIGFGTGVTVLLRMKRQPQVQAFFEFLNCADFETGPKDHHIWEHDVASRLLFVIKTGANIVPRVYKTSTTPLTSNASEWVNLGFTSTAAADTWGVFVNDAFLSPSVVSLSSQPDFTLLPQNCFRFGKRLNDARMFKGTVRAIAMCRGVMSESEIRDFFAVFN